MLCPLNPHPTNVWESLILPGGGHIGPPRKLAIFAIVWTSRQQKTYQGTLGTLRWTLIRSRTRLGPSMDPTGTLKWTLWFSSLFQGPYTISTLYILLCPSNHFGTPFWSLWNSIMAQGTLLDLYGPQNGPPNGPCEANFWGPLLEKGPPGSLDGPNWSIFFIAHKTSD